MVEKYYWQDKQANIYGPFRMVDEGNPHSGDVVQHYRLLKHISTKMLGKQIGKSARHVQEMENDNMVPELISRRKALIRVLGIPPILLFPNLYADDDLVKIEDQYKSPVQAYTGTPSRLDLRCYADMLQLYWSILHINGAQHALNDVEAKISLLQSHVTESGSKERSKALSLLCRYRLLAARLAEYRTDYEKVFHHYQQAIAIAKEMSDPGLQAVSYLYRGFAYEDQGKLVEANYDLKQAYSFEKQAPALLVARMQLGLGHMMAQDSKALTLIEQAGKIIRDGRKEEDTYFVNLHEGKYHMAHAQALMVTGHLEEAEEALQLAHETSFPDRITDHNYIDLLQIRLAMQSRQYVIAASTALQTFDLAQQYGMKRNIKMLANVHQQLVASNYGESKDVREFGEKLREWNKKKHLINSTEY